MPINFNRVIVNTDLSLEFLDDVLEQCVVKVLASQKRIPICGFYFKDSFLNLQNRDIKGATTQIVDSDSIQDRN